MIVCVLGIKASLTRKIKIKRQMIKKCILAIFAFNAITCGQLRLKTQDDNFCKRLNCICASNTYWANNAPVDAPRVTGAASNIVSVNGSQITNTTVVNTTQNASTNLQGLNNTNTPPFSCDAGISDCFNKYGNCKRLGDDSCGWDSYTDQLKDCLNQNTACRRLSYNDNVSCQYNNPVTVQSTSFPAVSNWVGCYEQSNIYCEMRNNATCGWNDVGKINRCLTGFNQPILTFN